MNNGKARIESNFGNYSIHIPSKKNWFALIFGTMWMGGWYWGLEGALGDFGYAGHDGADGFITLWTIAWTLGGISVIIMLLWGYFGQEKLEFDRDELKFEKTVFGVGIKKRLTIKEVSNFRFEKIEDSIFGGNRWAFWGMGPGKVKFDYGLKTYSFGLGVDDAEAVFLAKELNNKIEN